MGGERGPLPKSNAVRRNSRSAKSRMEAPAAEAPELVGEWRDETWAWWRAWVASPQAENFASTDWQRLVMLAPLVDAYFASPTPQMMAEIRQNESKLGATAMDRERLGWTIDAPPEPVAEGAEAKGSRSRPDPRRK